MRLLVPWLLLLATVVLAPQVPASAGCRSVPVEVTNPETGQIVIVMKEVCDRPREDGASGSSGCRANNREIPCTRGRATWNADHYCYAYPSSDYDDSRGEEHGPWQGHSDGSIYACLGDGPDMLDIGTPTYFWVRDPNPPVDGEALARTAVESMPLVRPTLHLAPTPPQMTYVGLETWLWIDQGQWTTVTGGTSVATASVTVTATPLRVSWDLGEGQTSCASGGKKWVTGSGAGASSDCSYAFQRVSDFEPGGKFRVSAVVTYDVEWACTGNCISPGGSIGEVSGPAGASAIRVGERQSVVVR